MVEQLELLERFNLREVRAFEEIHLMFYRELHLYASMLYKNSTIAAEDILQDVFVDLWSSKTKFSHLLKIKGYIYTAIKNDFINYVSHEKYVKTFKDNLDKQDYIDIFECEIYSEIDNILNLLPQDYAKVISLLLDGYKPAEIAEKLGRTPQSIYNVRHEAIKILKKKLSPDKLMTFLLLIK